MLTLAVQYALYHLMLRRALQTHDVGQMRSAVFRWLKVALVLQVSVVVLSATYMAVLRTQHPPGVAWVAPALGAIFGTAIPLQVAVMAIMRAARGS